MSPRYGACIFHFSRIKARDVRTRVRSSIPPLLREGSSCMQRTDVQEHEESTKLDSADAFDAGLRTETFLPSTKNRREREREKPTFFFRRLRGPSSSGGCEERESRGERKRKSGGERKEERKLSEYTNVTIIEIRIIMYIYKVSLKFIYLYRGVKTEEKRASPREKPILLCNIR